ncbi:MAG TPA: PBP1A family penicillin-binding protein [Pyrinomonadaceae bacterium]|nr:PBP1A family penicillin-binding protein [Pyrinomonadaceae bacterium]
MRSRRSPKGGAEVRRVVAYQGPPPSRFRRVARFFINPWIVTFTLVFVLIGLLSFTYFWFDFSDRIDRRLLSGEIYTPSAGIYSAPKTLKAGERVTVVELIDYLKSAGYIEKNNKADQSRSRYSVIEGKLVIEPGTTGVLDGKKIFPPVSVSFAKDGKSVNGIADLELKAQVDKIKLEPKMLSSTVAAEGDGLRRTVTFADIPPHLVKAITVTEDRAFFEHYGVNFRGIARALWRRYEKEGDDSPLANQGGSSITQQLVKNLLLNNDPTLERKVTEAFMSVILETRLSKEEIFTLYANQIYLGQQSGVSIYGVGEAANVYFGKDVSQLTLGEAAFMAGIIRSPNRYGPYKNPERVEERRNQVIDSMLEAGEIGQPQAADARATRLVLKPVTGRKDLQGMPYFSQFAIEELPKVVSDPEALQHYRVYTSIDPDLQRIAYATMADRLDKLEKYFPKQPKGNLNGALVAIRPKTGEIVAMVGGRDFQQNQFNRATDAMRQPGSVFKPFVYATAINSAYDTASRVFTAATVFKDEKKIFTFNQDTYAPNNYGDTFSNKETTLRDALVKSKNTITVDIGMQVNIGKVMNLANKAGMPKVERAYPSMALGTAEASPLNVAAAYTMFANLGDRVAPMPITQVTQGDGTTVSAPQVDKKNVIRPDVAYIMDDMMKDVINRGTAAQAQGWGFKNVAGKTAFAGKTGTSRDGWFAGFTPELVCVVYVGFDDNDDLAMKGADSAMPIWADFMKEALQLHPEWNGDWAMPANVRKAEIDIRNGLLIREIEAADIAEVKPTPTASVSPTPKIEGLDDPEWATEQSPESKENFATNVPAEFRRIELFVGGTIPPREMIDTSAPVYDDSGLSPEPEEGPPTQPTPSPTPLSNTWENIENRSDSSSPARRSSSSTGDRNTVTVMVCPVTGMRVTANCPYGEARTFQKGSEPKDFCTLHR